MQLLDQVVNFAVTGFYERQKLLIVRLPILIAHYFRHRCFQGGKIWKCQFQNDRVKLAREIRQETLRDFNSSPFLNCNTFLHDSHRFTSLSELQPKRVTNNYHKQLLSLFDRPLIKDGNSNRYSGIILPQFREANREVGSEYRSRRSYDLSVG